MAVIYAFHRVVTGHAMAKLTPKIAVDAGEKRGATIKKAENKAALLEKIKVGKTGGATKVCNRHHASFPAYFSPIRGSNFATVACRTGYLTKIKLDTMGRLEEHRLPFSYSPLPACFKNFFGDFHLAITLTFPRCYF